MNHFCHAGIGWSAPTLVTAHSCVLSWWDAVKGTRAPAEWTRYHERGYQSTSVGARISIGVPHWFVRVGTTRANSEYRPYVGITYNGF